MRVRFLQLHLRIYVFMLAALCASCTRVSLYYGDEHTLNKKLAGWRVYTYLADVHPKAMESLEHEVDTASEMMFNFAYIQVKDDPDAADFRIDSVLVIPPPGGVIDTWPEVADTRPLFKPKGDVAGGEVVIRLPLPLSLNVRVFHTTIDGDAYYAHKFTLDYTLALNSKRVYSGE